MSKDDDSKMNVVSEQTQTQTQIQQTPQTQDEDQLQSNSKKKKFLENKIKTRLMRDELVEKGVLMKGDVAPALLQRQHELERNKMQDKLGNLVSKRPTADELYSRNILQNDEDLTVKEMTKLHLTEKLASRPDRSLLVEKGMIKDVTTESLISSDVQNEYYTIQKAKLQEILAKKVASRPTRQELIQNGILKSTSTDLLSNLNNNNKNNNNNATTTTSN